MGHIAHTNLIILIDLIGLGSEKGFKDLVLIKRFWGELMKKFLIPLAAAIAALVSQQSLASDTSNQEKASLSNPSAETINGRGAIVPVKSRYRNPPQI